MGTGPVVQDQGRFWQRPASRVDSTPFFLAAQRRTASTVKKKLLFTLARKYTRVCGPLCDPSGSSQAMPSLSGASTVLVSTLVLDCNCKSVCSSFNDQAAEQQTCSLSPPQGIFALQKSLRGGLRWGTGSPTQRTQLPRKEISRGNLLCAESGFTSLSYPRPATAQKYETTPGW